MKSSLTSRALYFFMEIIVVIFFFALASAICVQVVVKANQMSDQAGMMRYAIAYGDSFIEQQEITSLETILLDKQVRFIEKGYAYEMQDEQGRNYVVMLHVNEPSKHYRDASITIINDQEEVLVSYPFIIGEEVL